METIKKNICILGSTGSIGTQTLDIIRENRDRFKVTVLTAGNNAELLVKQAREFHPHSIVIANEGKYEFLKNQLSDLPVKIYCGSKAISEIVTDSEIDMVVTAMVGYSGLIPTINAIKSKKTIALANKETLVVAGEIITQLATEFNVDILPVDSEHSAIFQCLVGENRRNLHKILLTASGGPFRKTPIGLLEKMKASDALKHPNWDMGAKVTIDSSTMMNKGFEMIEAKWLFNCSPRDIEVLVHPQSIIHSMVEYSDGSIKAQLGIPDMRIPIGYALGFPKRLKTDTRFLNLSQFKELTFEEPDTERFPLLKTAYFEIEKGGHYVCMMNAANEVAVKAFLEDRIRFTDIPRLVDYAMNKGQFISNPNLEQLIETNDNIRQLTADRLKDISL